MDYREHTKQRFKEKFVPINLQSNKIICLKKFLIYLNGHKKKLK